MTILYVEDEAIISISVTEDLVDAGYQVESKVTCAEAYDFLQGADVSLLITDINTPGSMNGWDLAQKAREINPMLPIIYTTAFGKNNEKIVPKSIYLPKPFTTKEMLKSIKKMI